MSWPILVGQGMLIQIKVVGIRSQILGGGPRPIGPENVSARQPNI